MLNTKTRSTTTVEAVVIRVDGTRETLGVVVETKELGMIEKIKSWLKGGVNNG
jgi:hypothetical protein